MRRGRLSSANARLERILDHTLGGRQGKGVASSDVAFRVNLLRFEIGQFDIAHPFRRPRGMWVLQFNLSTAF